MMHRKDFLKRVSVGATVSSLASVFGIPVSAEESGSTVRAGLDRGLLTPSFATGGIRRLKAGDGFHHFRKDLEPRYRVVLGELVLVETQHGLPGRVTREGEFRESRPDEPVNPMTGPVFVEGIAVGDGLAIDLLEIRVGDWGYAGGRVYRFEDGYAIFDQRLKLPLAPMLGGLGITPSEGEVDTKAPGDTGGNMDCREVRAGSTVVFTAQVDGGLVGMGDAHALQGDGEVRGQGLECDAEALVRFRKLPSPLSPRPVILRQEFVATLGAHKDLNEAAWQATDDMINLIVSLTGRDKADAYALVNLVGNLRINQIVDPKKGARMEVPSWVFGVI